MVVRLVTTMTSPGWSVGSIAAVSSGSSDGTTQTSKKNA